MTLYSRIFRKSQNAGYSKNSICTNKQRRQQFTNNSNSTLNTAQYQLTSSHWRQHSKEIPKAFPVDQHTRSRDPTRRYLYYPRQAVTSQGIIWRNPDLGSYERYRKNSSIFEHLRFVAKVGGHWVTSLYS
ncbi:hypothetical protein AVEN_224165-1 [Araneus ventricosus]|uniref:Uncharacterized protein n=1 Tax=Araneus ventricosus TaxID=182803 RepID=A0A4Y2TBB4_ARAVE|nr:hypothetical protein AVEN_224165-1 [Araneus ventricosus]